MEDIFFKQTLKDMGITRTKDMYRKAHSPHQCMMCTEKVPENGWVLKDEYVHGFDTPYWSICNDCYKELD